jgi:polyhydroxyalkanoate synthesis regulator phasin
MKKRTKLAAGAGAALAVVGAGGALASDRLTPSDESKAVVDDAAKQLGVDPAKLNAALRKALENRIDQAVKAGRLTEEQGKAMKERIEAGDFPLFGGPGFGGHRGFALHGFRDLSTAAAFLGVDEAALRERLRDGDTLAEVAKEKGTSVDALVTAIVAATTKRIDEAVAAGRITKAQRDEIVAGLKKRTTEIVNGDFPAFRGRGGPGFDGPAFGPRFGGHGFGPPRLAPAPDDAA